MHVVVNHLRFRDPVGDELAGAMQEAVQAVVGAGGVAARVIRVDDTHLILLLEFASAEDAERVSREVGGPWMREHVVPLLAGGTERSVGEVIAEAHA
jgi:hypothetical protein